MAIQNWMINPHPWKITTTNENGVTKNDSVVFNTSDPLHPTVEINGVLWGYLDPGSLTFDGATGVTSPSVIPPGQPFQISFTPESMTIDGTSFHDEILSCFLQEPQRRSHWLAVGLGIGAGTLLGGAVGFAAGSLLLGSVAALVAATTGSLVTSAFRKHEASVQGGGSNPVWTAGDPGIGGRGTGHPGPHSVVKATA